MKAEDDPVLKKDLDLVLKKYVLSSKYDQSDELIELSFDELIYCRLPRLEDRTKERLSILEESINNRFSKYEADLRRFKMWAFCLIGGLAFSICILILKGLV